MAGFFTITERFARKSIPAFAAPLAKQMIAWPRYYTQLKKSRSQYHLYKHLYPQTTLYVAGLPKSGTTWFEKMLGSFPGFSEVMIPEAVRYEQQHGESHSFELPVNLFQRFHNALVVLKLHAHGSAHNIDVLQRNRINYVVMYRDLRDVAVSHVFYVKRTAYHPEHKVYKTMTTQQALYHFAGTLLPQFIDWVNSWYAHAQSPQSLIIRYEDLLADPYNTMQQVVKHYGIHTTDDSLQTIIKQNSFEQLSGGRSKGQADTSSFFRSGTSGDWKKHFDGPLTRLYNERLSQFNAQYGYPS